MTIKEKLQLMKEAEKRNRKRIADFIEKARKQRLRSLVEKTDEYRGDDNKRK